MNQALLYSKYNNLQKSDISFVLSNYFYFIKWKSDGGDVILDIGCGSGDVTSEILLPLMPNSIGRVIGADISQDMVDFANNNYANSKVSFLQMNIACEKTPIEFQNAFDHIFSFYCLHWVQNQRQAFVNIRKMLKPDGDVLITFLANNPIFEIYKRLSQQDRWQSYMNNFSKFISPYQYSTNPQADLEKVLKDAGFTKYTCRVEHRTYTYPNVITLKKSVIAVNPFLHRIPDDMKEKYISDYLSEVKRMEFMEDNNNHNEPIKVPYQLFVVYAQK